MGVLAASVVSDEGPRLERVRRAQLSVDFRCARQARVAVRTRDIKYGWQPTVLIVFNRIWILSKSCKMLSTFCQNLRISQKLLQFLTVSKKLREIS